MPFDPDDDWQKRRDRIIGLGERSFHKSYYPQLQQNIERLERFRTLLDQTADFVMLLALPDGTIVDANAALGRLIDEPAETLIGRPFTSLGIEDAVAILDALQREMPSQRGHPPPIFHSALVGYGRASARIWLELSYGIAVLDDHCYGVVVGRDVTVRRRNEEMVVALLAEKQALLDNALVGIVMVRERRIVSCNRRMEELFGYGSGDLVGKSMRVLYPSDEAYLLAGEAAYSSLAHGQNFSSGLAMLRADGSELWIEITGRALDAAQPHAGSVWIVTDISERKAAEERAAYLAYYDVLTGLPNRSLVQDRMKQAVAAADRAATKVALLVVDLDRFKTINDSLGHALGDRLLVEVAKRLKLSLDEGDTLCRQGGDEFLILLPDLQDTDACVSRLAKLTDGLALPFHVDALELPTTVSMGIAIYPDDGPDLSTLLKKADMAMYRAKEAGRNTYRFFNEDMNDEAEERLSLHFNLRRALDAGQFVLHYQPQIEIASGRLVGAEALLRWNHPTQGLVPPGRFIPVAEESGLIVPIGEWVLREACREAAGWQRQGMADVVVAVNLSALQFKRGDIEESVTKALEESRLDPELLELELTESILIQDTENVLATVMRLKHMGVRLSIDDFGTGYSSLAYLKRFKVDKLKIDQSFIRSLAKDPDDAAIVRAVVQMARSLGLRTIAEGVEDHQALNHLRLYHCDEAQGFLFSRPVPAPEFIAGFRQTDAEP
jgi:diguanylate cyclase (GGDEF)-like protein/PAS domain S-box-containing protein